MSGDEITVPIVSDVDNAESAICFLDPHETEYGEKVYIESPYSAKEDIEALGWDATHRRWDPAADKWEIDFDRLAYAITRLEATGYEISVTADVVDGIEDT